MRVRFATRSIRTHALLGRAAMLTIVRTTLHRCGVSAGTLDLSVVYLDARSMREANEQYRHQPGPTDILSFVYQPSATIRRERRRREITGEILLCPSVIRTRARRHQRTVAAETKRLLVHGMLHLLGFDHESLRDTRRMDEAELRILGAAMLAGDD